MLKKAYQHGFTVVELLIAMGLSALLFTALLAIFINNLTHYNKVISTNHLNQQLQTTLQLMADDIRRAGFWASANGDIGLNQNNNPFMTNSTDISVSNTNDCILFTYDHGKTGALPSVSPSIDDDRYGFQLVNQTIQARPPGASFVCNAIDWENVTDPGIVQITALNFTLNTQTIITGPSTRGITMRSVDISITGRLASDSTVTNTLTQHVRIQNDKFIP